MQIHTVTKNDTLYTIGRKYSIPATKILTDNDLCTDRLTIGEEIVILKPTKTVTVKGGDTLDLISKRFGVRKSSIIRDNPCLLGKEKLRPGQILTVKQEEIKIGAGSVLGYAEKGCRRDKIAKAMPYTTYLTISSAIIKGTSVIPTFSSLDIKKSGEEAGKIIILGIKDETRGDFLRSKEAYRRVINDAVSLAEDNGFMGLSFSADEGSRLYPNAYCEFLFELRKRLIGCNMILFTEVFENTPEDASEICDGGILNIPLSGIKDDFSVMREFCKSRESSKVFVKICTSVKLSDEIISADEIKELCYRSGKELITDEVSLISYFDYVKYRIGKGEVIRLSFPSLRYIKAKLEGLYELGFMGIACDLDTTPLSNLTMFNSMFARADYSLA